MATPGGKHTHTHTLTRGNPLCFVFLLETELEEGAIPGSDATNIMQHKTAPFT